MCRTFNIIRCDLLDEFWHINAGGATFHAGRIITKQTTVGFYQGSIGRFKRRMNIAEVLFVLLFCKPVC